jgi:Arc/MetJ family transcription regulator
MPLKSAQELRHSSYPRSLPVYGVNAASECAASPVARLSVYPELSHRDILSEAEGALMAKTLIDVDEEQLAAAQKVLNTATKKDTVNAALRQVTALAARRRDLQRLVSGGLPDLADEGVMRAAWQR